MGRLALIVSSDLGESFHPGALFSVAWHVSLTVVDEADHRPIEVGLRTPARRHRLLQSAAPEREGCRSSVREA